MKNTLLERILLVGLTAYALVSSSSAAETEEVTLKDGKTYRVPTQGGMPEAFRSRQIEVRGLGPLYSSTEKMEWLFHATLHEEGAFTVTATSPLSTTALTIFECTGPGEISQLLFAKDEFPELWEWFEDPATSWIPIVFSFESKDSRKRFEVVQWTKFDAVIKVKIRRARAGPRQLSGNAAK